MMNSTIQTIAMRAIRLLVTSNRVDWLRVYRIERRFNLVGYGDRFHDGILEVRRAYIQQRLTIIALPPCRVALN